MDWPLSAPRVEVTWSPCFPGRLLPRHPVSSRLAFAVMGAGCADLAAALRPRGRLRWPSGLPVSAPASGVFAYSSAGPQRASQLLSVLGLAFAFHRPLCAKHGASRPSWQGPSVSVSLGDTWTEQQRTAIPAPSPGSFWDGLTGRRFIGHPSSPLIISHIGLKVAPLGQRTGT